MSFYRYVILRANVYNTLAKLVKTIAKFMAMILLLARLYTVSSLANIHCFFSCRLRSLIGS